MLAAKTQTAPAQAPYLEGALVVESQDFAGPTYRWIEGDQPSMELLGLIDAVENDKTLLCKEALGVQRLKEAMVQLTQQPTKANKDRVERLADRLQSRYDEVRTKGCFAPQEFMSEEEMRFKRSVPNPGFTHPVMERLREALERYMAIAQEGGWEPVRLKDVAFIRPKKRYSEIPAIKRRLAIEGYYHGPLDQNLTYDNELELAVREFQRHHGLKVDGVIGPRTIRAMNESVESKIRKILINMERFRWIMGEDEYFVLVNIPGFFLDVYDHNGTIFHSKVVVGRKKRPTPIMRHAIAYAVLNPYWRAPKTIIKEDILPYLQQGNFERIERKGIIAAKDYKGRKVVDFRDVNWSEYEEPDKIPFYFMQTPGPHNFLGRIKLIFPNKFDVYLHDTSNKRIFNYRYRALSSGCIRVQKPIKLFHLLRSKESDITYKEIFDIIATKETKKIRFGHKVPIYLAYLTVYVDDGGEVYFYRDLYGYDKRFAPLLKGVKVVRGLEGQ